AQRLKQSEMIIDSVHVTHAMLDKFIVKACPKLRSHLDSKRHDPFLRAREESKKCRAIIAGEIDAIVESSARNGSGGGKTAEAGPHYEKAVEAGDRGCKLRARR